jgi:hypothetical protein
VLRLGDKELLLRRPGARPHIKGNSKVLVAAARCDRVAAMRLEGTLEAADSLAGMGSRASHQAEARTPVQPSREVPVMMSGDRRSEKHMREARPQKDHGTRDE